MSKLLWRGAGGSGERSLSTESVAAAGLSPPPPSPVPPSVAFPLPSVLLGNAAPYSAVILCLSPPSPTATTRGLSLSRAHRTLRAVISSWWAETLRAGGVIYPSLGDIVRHGVGFASLWFNPAPPGGAAPTGVIPSSPQKTVLGGRKSCGSCGEGGILRLWWGEGGWDLGTSSLSPVSPWSSGTGHLV